MAFETKIAYCTNVHAGPDLAGVKKNLSLFTLKVRQSLLDSGDWLADEPLGVGLWLADSAAREVLIGDELHQLREWLNQHGLLAFTLNGFPQNNFHQAIVKHRVYEPTWWQVERFDYTRRLIQILHTLMPEGQLGSISTLPIAWSVPQPTHDEKKRSADHLKQIAIELDRLRQACNREIVIAIEPEPGCAITDGRSMRTFFEQYLFDDADRDLVARHITVCHDICHAAVMREDQANEVAAYRDHGIRIGKVQVSSAIEVDWSEMSPSQRTAAFQHLAGFAEDRYLHQTTVYQQHSQQIELHEDLPELMKSILTPELLHGSWRVHFHVPIFYSKAGPLNTTQRDILKCMHSLYSVEALNDNLTSNRCFTGHLEVETYAWSVLPESHRGTSLAEDIASELRYLRLLVRKKVFPRPNKSLHLRGEEDR